MQVYIRSQNVSPANLPPNYLFEVKVISGTVVKPKQVRSWSKELLSFLKCVLGKVLWRIFAPRI